MGQSWDSSMRPAESWQQGVDPAESTGRKLIMGSWVCAHACHRTRTVHFPCACFPCSICHPLPTAARYFAPTSLSVAMDPETKSFSNRRAVVQQHDKGNSCPREIRQMTGRVICSNQISLIFFLFLNNRLVTGMVAQE